MDKPKMKREIAINDILPRSKVIYLFASEDALDDIKEFGEIKPYPGRSDDYYILSVDHRFDFDEVVAYIEGY